jgi:hypothetical protein
MAFYYIFEDRWINLDNVEMIEIDSVEGKYEVWFWVGRSHYTIRNFNSYQEAEDFVNEILEFTNKK